MGFLDEQVVVTRRTMVLIFIVDTSSSMEGSKIGAVNIAIEEVLPEIAKMSENNTDAEIKIAVLDFSSDAKWTAPAPILAKDFVWNNLNASGLTAFGEACLELNEKLSRNKFMEEPLGSFAPALFLMSDGEPTDKYLHGLEKLKQNAWFQKAIKVTVAIGEKANTQVLEEFTGTAESVLMVHNPEALKKMIKFLSVTASEIGSKSSSIGLGNINDEGVFQTKQDVFSDALANMKPAATGVVDDEDEKWE